MYVIKVYVLWKMIDFEYENIFECEDGRWICFYWQLNCECDRKGGEVNIDDVRGKGQTAVGL